MELYKYSVDGSTLSLNERKKLIHILENHSDSGIIYENMEKGLYQALFEETVDISSLPFPHGTILKRIYQ